MSTEAPAGRAEPAFQTAIWTALYSLPAIVAMLPHLDQDVWWHLRTGQWVVEHGGVPTTDPFSRHGLETGKAWFAYTWLFDVLLYGAYRLLGYQAILLFRLLLTLALVAAFHRLIGKREPRFLAAAALAGACFFAFFPLVSERPWLLSILFSALTLDVILDLRAGKRAPLLWLLPFLFGLWSNLHVQFVYGLLLLGLACAAPVIDWVLRNRPDRGAGRAGSGGWWLLVGLTAACAGATLLNPYGVQLYRVVLEYGAQRAPLTHIAEMRALDYRDPWDWVMPVLGGLAAFQLGRRARPSAFDVLLLAAAAWFAFRSRRDVWFLVLAAAAVLVTARPARAALRFLPDRRQALAVAACLAVVLGGLWCCTATDARIRAAMEQEYPVEAAVFVRDHGCPGPLYNHFNWGGYLIWQLPEYPVSMDGRANLHGEQRLDRMVNTWSGLPGWDDDPDLASARLVIADAQTPLATVLRLDPRFEVAHEDRRAVVFVARRPAPGLAQR